MRWLDVLAALLLEWWSKWRARQSILVMRDNVIKRTHHQRTGYWKPDGEGMEDIAPREWAAALDLLGGGASAPIDLA